MKERLATTPQEEVAEWAGMDPRRCKVLRADILTLCQTSGLDADCGMVEGEAEDQALGKLGYANGGTGPYFLGPEVSLVDLDYYPHFERFAVLTRNRQCVGQR